MYTQNIYIERHCVWFTSKKGYVTAFGTNYDVGLLDKYIKFTYPDMFAGKNIILSKK